MDTYNEDQNELSVHADNLKSKQQLIDELYALREKLDNEKQKSMVKIMQPQNINDGLQKENIGSVSEKGIRYGLVLNAMDDWVHVIDEDLNIIFINDAMLKICDKIHTRPSIIGHNIMKSFPFLSEYVEEEYQQVLRTGKEVITEDKNVIDNRVIYTETRKIPVVEGNEVVNVLTIMRDISERKISDDLLRLSGERFNKAFHANPSMMAIIKVSDDVCLDANRSFLINTGYSREELVGYSIKKLRLWKEPEDRRIVKKVLHEKSVQSLEVSYRNKSGEKRYGLAYKENVTIDGEECYLGVMVDITDFKVIKEALEVKEEMYRRIVETAQEGIWLVDTDYRTTFVNEKMAEMLGYTVEEMTGELLYAFMDEEWRAIAKEHGKLRKQGTAEQYEFKYHKKDGEEVWTLSSVSPFFAPDGSWAGSLGMIADITHRKEAEKALRESNRRVADILNFLPDSTLVIDCQGRVIAWNKAAEEMTGIKSEDILGKGDYEHSIPFYRYRRPILVDHVLNYEQDWEPNYSRIEIKGKALIGENLCRTIDNPEAYLWAIATPLYDIQGNITGAIESIRDITDRRRAEDDLKASEEQYRRIVETANEGIWLNDRDNKITFVNEKMAKLLGYTVESIIGCSLFKFIAKDHRQMACIMMERNRKGIRVEHDFKFRCRDGSSIWAVVSMTPIYSTDKKYVGSLAMISDVTERKKLEMQMARLDRLNLVGQIAACIGHEIRNPMTSVRGFLQILAGEEIYKQDKEHFELMIEELDRANSIITEFLSLAKNKAIELKLNDLNSIVKSIFPLINAEALVQDKFAQVHLEEIPKLLLDESEIRQLILNLARNALEAMPPEKGLMVKTFRDGAEVILLVEDQGSGIHPDILGEIGTPFITTKEEGTGLGLPVCYSIAARHDAAIEVESGAGGTTFFVRFKTPAGI